MNSWIKKENKDKDREKPKSNWRKHDDGRNRNKSELRKFALNRLLALRQWLLVG